MRARSRRVALLESLEDRNLLSTAVASVAEVSPLVKAHPIHIVGSIPGGVIQAQVHQIAFGFEGAGTLGILGPVQTKMTFVQTKSATGSATLTLTSNQGTLTFLDQSKSGGFGRNSLKLLQGTGAYAGWSGTGSLVIKFTGPGGYRHVQPDVNIFKLTLRT